MLRANATSKFGIGSPATRLLQFLFAALVIVACSAEDTVGRAAVDQSISATTSEAVPTTESTTTSTTTSTTSTTTEPVEENAAPPLEEDGIPRVARTSTGVVLPVLTPLEEGYLVNTPCQNTAVVLDAEVNDRVHVVLDPGHGGSETGAVSPNGIVEGDINLVVALLAEEILTEQGYEVTLTRYDDIRVPLVSRVEIADRLEADLLISIHHQASNQFPTSDTPGVEVFYQQLIPESKRFAGILHEETLEAYSDFDITWFTGADAGAVYRLNTNTGTDFYGMIRLPETTAVLAEMGFLGNPEEIELIRTGELLPAEAEAIANAVIRWFTTDDPGSGFVEPSFSLTAAGSGGGIAGCEDPDLGATLEFSAAFGDDEDVSSEDAQGEDTAAE